MGIRASTLLLFLMTSCHSPQGEWHTEHVRSHAEKFSSSRLFSTSKSPARTFDIEWIRTTSSVKAYLFVHHATLASMKGDPCHLQLSFVTQDKKATYIAYLLEGKQKCLLPQEATDFIIDALNNNQEVTMMTTGYKRVLSPVHFKDAYQAFMHKAPWEIPFEFKLE